MSILKQGEINAIVNNFTVVKADKGREEGRIGNNSIHLASSHEHRVSLRTNGLVVYGVYYNGEQKIKFTHDFMRYAKPYVKCDDYMELKDVILKAWEKTFDDKAKAKLEEVKAIVKELLNRTYKAQKTNNTNKKVEVNNMKPEVKTITKEMTPSVPTVEKVQIQVEAKKDVQETKANKDAKRLHPMKIAHIIRKALKLEGHYHVQMKIAMNLAWKVKKGLLSLEDLIAEEKVEPEVNTNTTSAVEETYTYNTAQEVKKETVQEPIVNTVADATDYTYRVYLKSFKNGVAQFSMKRNDGAERPFFATKARNLVDLDKQFAKVLGNALKNCKDNTVLEYYGQYTYLTYCNTEALKEYAASRNITLTLGVAPSGDVA